MTIPKDIQHLFYAKSMAEVLKQSKPLQVRLANVGKNEHCNVTRYMHWWNKTASLTCKIKVNGIERILLITSNN